MGIDQSDRVYIPFVQSVSGDRLFLSRYDGSDVKIWDNDASTFTDTFANADPVDNGTSGVNSGIWDPVVDSQGRVYIAFANGPSVYGVYLIRYDGTDVKIWDNDSSTFTNTFSDGDQISNTSQQYVQNGIYNLVIDSADRVYIPFMQDNGRNALYLSRFDGTDVGIWDNDTSSFTDTFGNGDPIDLGSGGVGTNGAISAAIDAADQVYILFRQDISGNQRLHLVRHTGTAAGIWDNDTDTFTSTFANGDPIDNGTSSSMDNTMQSTDAVISRQTGELFYTFEQSSKVYLGRVSGIPLGSEIDVQGHSVSIVDGDATPSSTDYTDFGSVTVGDAASYSYGIENSGDATLTLSGSPHVALSDSSDFTVTSQPNDSIAASADDAFVIRFAPTSAGLKTVTVTIQNNDGDEGNYHFVIQGTGLPAIDTDHDGTPDFLDNDDDNDGISDFLESLDGTNPLDAGSAREVLSNTWCSEWNGFFGMYNVNEYENIAVVDRAIDATLNDAEANPQSETTLTVLANGQTDLLVHEMPGFRENSYGTICSEAEVISVGDVDIATPPVEGVDGRTVYYKSNATGYDFAFALPFTTGLTGSQFTLFNTYQPSQDPADSANVVANWIQVTNLAETQQSGALIYYAQDGTVLGTDQGTLAPRERHDFAAHQFGPNRVGVVEWRPVSTTAAFITRNVRYYYDNPAFTESFASAAQTEGLKGNGELLGVPIDTRDKFSVLEIGNTTENQIGVSVTFYNEGGAIVDYRQLTLDGNATIHIIANDILVDALGSVTVNSDTAGSLIAVGMHYGRTASMGLEYAYSLVAKQAFGDTLTSSYNTYLGQSCELLLEDTSGIDTTATINVTRLDGTEIVAGDTVNIPAHGITSYDPCAKDEVNQYGVVKVITDLNHLVATVIRVGENNDYRFPTPARGLKQINICSLSPGATGC